jgi:hypothetical protein
MPAMTVFSTPRRARHKVAFRTPFSAHWFLFLDSRETQAGNGVFSPQARSAPTEASGEPEMKHTENVPNRST